MTTSQQQTPVRPDHQGEDAHGRNALHLCACLAAGALVVLAVLAIHWLA